MRRLFVSVQNKAAFSPLNWKRVLSSKQQLVQRKRRRCRDQTEAAVCLFLHMVKRGWWRRTDVQTLKVSVSVLTDFYQGKTVFKHWLPGVCYRNITFQLISEATVYQTALVSQSDVTHTPVHHRTGETPTQLETRRAQSRMTPVRSFYLWSCLNQLVGNRPPPPVPCRMRRNEEVYFIRSSKY